MWVVKEKTEKGNRKIYRKSWKLSAGKRRELWEFACYVILAVMLMVMFWYEYA